MKKYFFILFAILFNVSACQPDNNEITENPASNKKSKISIKFNSSIKSRKETFNENNVYNQTALFIAGKNSELFKTIQKQDYYKNYKNKINE